MPTDKQVRSTPISTEEGDEVVIAQENTGGDNMLGSGEWPSPSTPAQPGAPGYEPAEAEEPEHPGDPSAPET